MSTQVIIATIPAGEESEFLNWEWKFYVEGTKLLYFTDGESNHYENGFIDALAAFRPDITITHVTIQRFDVDALTIGKEDVSLLEAKLAELIPLGTIEVQE